MAEMTKTCPITKGKCTNDCAWFHADYSHDDYECAVLSIAMRMADIKRMVQNGRNDSGRSKTITAKPI